MYRHLLIENWNQKKLDKTTVLIAGAGAVGSQTATILARMGIKMVVVDNDILEEHNIGNQVYTRKHIGLSKVNALKGIVKDIEDVEFTGVKSLVEDIDLSKYNIDIFLGAIDSIGTRYYLNAVALNSGKAYIDAGIEGYSGSVRTMLPYVNSCMMCWPSLNKEIKLRPGCSQDPVPSTYFTAGHAANIQVMQMLNLLFGKPTHDLVSFNLITGTSTAFSLRKNKNCELCSAT
jgi:molybdopterin/thiamine biosynthesis adenylyltransferase